jgi:hypothetical protein
MVLKQFHTEVATLSLPSRDFHQKNWNCKKMSRKDKKSEIRKILFFFSLNRLIGDTHQPLPCSERTILARYVLLLALLTTETTKASPGGSD